MHNQSDNNIKYSRKFVERLNSIIPEIVDAFDPSEIILYGSYARGEQSPYSDINILIIAQTTLRFQDRSIRALEIISDDDLYINPLVYTSEEFENMLKQKESFLVTALKESVLLWKKDANADLEAQLEQHTFQSEYRKYIT